jgi:hypothetical protein
MYNKVGILLRKISEKQGQFSVVGSDLVTAVNAGIDTFNKYYNSLGEHDLYYIATILDP